MQDPYGSRIWQNKYPDALPVELDFPSISALDIFEQSVAEKPNLPALHYFDISFSYKEIDTMAAALAAGLADFGLTKGNRVIIQLQNIPQYLISLYAVWKLAAIAVTLNPMFKSKEMVSPYIMEPIQSCSWISCSVKIHPARFIGSEVNPPIQWESFACVGQYCP